ncbi:MAG: hypothetical protein HY040_18525 [Planctomycetes bacterium]|nr:hypothetical protein [Planctomycetota bacterium]
MRRHHFLSVVLAMLAAAPVAGQSGGDVRKGPLKKWSVVVQLHAPDKDGFEQLPFQALAIEVPEKLTFMRPSMSGVAFDVKDIQAIEWKNQSCKAKGEVKSRCILRSKSEPVEFSSISSEEMGKSEELMKLKFEIKNEQGIHIIPIEHLKRIIFLDAEARTSRAPKTAKESPQLYINEGAHYAFINNFGDGPYISSSRYVEIFPGMRLLFWDDGNFQLRYRAGAYGGPAQASWDLRVYFMKANVLHEIALKTFPCHIDQTKDICKDQREIVHDGYHPGIREHFRAIRSSESSGRFERCGRILFETEHQ